MSSNIRIQRICQHCNNEFTARTTVTKYCSHKCASRAYKDRTRKKKVEKSNAETKKIITQPVEVAKAKEFLTVKDVSILLGCSTRTAYRLINNETIKAVNLGQRVTRVKRSEIDKLFQSNSKPQTNEAEPIQYNIEDCYTINEVLNKYQISDNTLRGLIKRNKIPKIKKGWYAYVPKQIIDELLT